MTNEEREAIARALDAMEQLVMKLAEPAARNFEKTDEYVQAAALLQAAAIILRRNAGGSAETP